jgi:hypothetical protein
MHTEILKGQFRVVESFALTAKNEFYLIGNLTEGEIQKNWFVYIDMNSSLSMTLRIQDIDDLHMSGGKEKYKLLTFLGENEILEILLGLNIRNESLNIKIEGQD